MSNVDNEGLRTLDEARAGRSLARFQAGRRLNPGELEEIEAAAQAGKVTCPDDVLALVNTISALARRIAKRFNETAQARQDAAAARERAESAERALEARGPMPDLGHLADAVAGRERLEREVNRLTAELFQARSGHVPGDEADLRRILADRQAQIEDLERELRCAHVREELLQAAVDDWQRAGQAIREEVFRQDTVEAVEAVQDRPMNWPAASTLAKAVRVVRGALGGSGGTVDS